MCRAPILSSIATIAFFLNGCSSTAVHGSVGDNAFGPTFTSTFFKSVTDGDAVAVVIVAITVDDVCAKVLALEKEERAAIRAFDESGASTPEAQQEANVILAAELDRIYAEYLPAPWWRFDLGAAGPRSTRWRPERVS